MAAEDARHARRHGRLHAAGTGAGQRDDRAWRFLLARLHALRDDHRPSALHQRQPSAVISQHINTPPVAPSWHAEACPLDLEKLILHLPAKDPSERPASAADVLRALETLASLNRESGFDRIVLRGLTRDEVGAYIKARANIEPRREVLDRIYEETAVASLPLPV